MPTRELMYAPSRFGKKPLTILNGSRKNSRQMRSVPLWIHRSPAGRGMESTDFQRKDMADREAGSGKEQKKRVATNRIKMDLQSWRKQNSWSCHLICPTERKADFDAERLLITRKFTACWHFCWHQNPLYLPVFQLLFNRCQQEHSKNFSIVFWKTEITTRKKFQTLCWHLCCQRADKLPAGTEANLSLSGTGKNRNVL